MMKKFILHTFALAALMAFGVFSQSATASTPDQSVTKARPDVAKNVMHVRQNRNYLEAWIPYGRPLGGTMTVYTRAGRQVAAYNDFVFQNGTGRAKLGRLSRGIYIVVFEADNGKSLSAKLLIS